MHPLTFILKQAHLKNVSFGKKVLSELPGMTPARFDLLWLLRRAVAAAGPGWKRTDGARLQSTLWKDLGLHRSTVSKMLNRLEEMGWIRRERAVDDGRTFTIGLTKKGLEMIGRAEHHNFGKLIMRKTYEHVFTEKPPTPVYPVPWSIFRKPEDLDRRGPDPILQWKAAEAAARAAALEPPKDVIEQMDEVYRSVRRIARYFGDRSTVWYHMGAGLPEV